MSNITASSYKPPEPLYNFEELKNNNQIANDAAIIATVSTPIRRVTSRLIALNPATSGATRPEIHVLVSQLPSNRIYNENRSAKEFFADFLYHKIALSFPKPDSIRITHSDPEKQAQAREMDEKGHQVLLGDYVNKVMSDFENDAPLTKHQIIQVLDKTDRLLHFAQARKFEQENVNTGAILSSFSQAEIARKAAKEAHQVASKKYFEEHVFVSMTEWGKFCSMTNDERERYLNLNYRGISGHLMEMIAPHSTMILEYDEENKSLRERVKPGLMTSLVPENRTELQEKAAKIYEVLENSLQYQYAEEYGLEAAKELTQFIFKEIDRSEPLTREKLWKIIGQDASGFGNSKLGCLNRVIDRLSQNISFAKNEEERTSPTQPTALEVVRLAISLHSSQKVERLYEALPMEIANDLLWSTTVGVTSDVIGYQLNELNQVYYDDSNQELEWQKESIEPVPPEVTDQRVINEVIHHQQYQISSENEMIREDNELINCLKQHPHYIPYGPYNPDNPYFPSLYPINAPYIIGIEDNNHVHTINLPSENNESAIHSLEQQKDVLTQERDQLAATVSQEQAENRILDQRLFHEEKVTLQMIRNEILDHNTWVNSYNASIIQQQVSLLAASQMRSFLIHAVTSYVLGFPVSLNAMRAVYKVGTKVATFLKAHADEQSTLPAQKLEESFKKLLDDVMKEAKPVDQEDPISHRVMEQSELIEKLLEDLEENVLTSFQEVEERGVLESSLTEKSRTLSEHEQNVLKKIQEIREQFRLAQTTHQKYFSVVVEEINENHLNESVLTIIQGRAHEIQENLKKLVSTLEKHEISDAFDDFFEYQAATANSIRGFMHQTVKEAEKSLQQYQATYEIAKRDLRLSVLAKEKLPKIPGAPDLELKSFKEVIPKTKLYRDTLTDREDRQKVFSLEFDQQLREYLNRALEYYEEKARNAEEDSKRFKEYRRTHLPI